MKVHYLTIFQEVNVKKGDDLTSVIAEVETAVTLGHFNSWSDRSTPIVKIEKIFIDDIEVVGIRREDILKQLRLDKGFNDYCVFQAVNEQAA